MKIIDTSKISDEIELIIKEIAVNVEESCVKKMQAALLSESKHMAKFALEHMVKNYEIAKKNNCPACQDTGMAVIFCSIGNDVVLRGEFIEKAINNAVSQGYKNLRKSVVDVISRKNTLTNTPAIIHYDFFEGDYIKLDVMLKGFGSENMSKLYMLTPADGLEGVVEKIVECVKLAGSNPCPPIIVGVGLGGTIEVATKLAKHALLKDLHSVNPDPTLCELETELLNKINALNIGAQGFCGDITALGVKIETFPTHISSIPLAINIQCHCSRHAYAEIYGEEL